MQLLCSIWVNMKSDCNHTQNRMEQLALPAQSCVAPRNPENAISEASKKSARREQFIAAPLFMCQSKVCYEIKIECR